MDKQTYLTVVNETDTGYIPREMLFPTPVSPAIARSQPVSETPPIDVNGDQDFNPIYDPNIDDLLLTVAKPQLIPGGVVGDPRVVSPDVISETTIPVQVATGSGSGSTQVSPSDGASVAVAPKKSINWLWIVLAAIAAYLLYKKMK